MKRLIRSVLASLSVASLSLIFPALAKAADGYVTGNVNLRAGPAPDYPLIARIPAGTEVNVQGCTEGWEWCDVIAYGDRGWVAGNYVEYDYQDRPVLLPTYGEQLGVPIVTFVIGNYWDNYYRGQPFYRERTRWYHRPIVRRPPPPLRHPYRSPLHGATAHGRMPVDRRYPSPLRRPMSGPIGPVHGLHTTPLKPPMSPGARPGRAEETRHPPLSPSAGHATPRLHQPARDTAAPADGARPASHRSEPAVRPAAPGKPEQGKSKASDKKDQERGH